MKEYNINFDTIDSANDHCEWLGDQLVKEGGELVVRYRKGEAEETTKPEKPATLAVGVGRSQIAIMWSRAEIEKYVADALGIYEAQRSGRNAEEAVALALNEVCSSLDHDEATTTAEEDAL